MIIKMADGGIISIETDADCTRGCDTCDYGSVYINEIIIRLTKFEIQAGVRQMYEYMLSEGDIMRIMISHNDEIKTMTEDEFAKWFKDQIYNIIDQSNESNDPEYMYEKIYY